MHRPAWHPPTFLWVPETTAAGPQGSPPSGPQPQRTEHPRGLPRRFLPTMANLGMGARDTRQPGAQRAEYTAPGPRPGSAEGRCGHTGDPSRGDPLRNGHEALLGCTPVATRGPTCTSRSAGSQTGMGLGHPSPPGVTHPAGGRQQGHLARPPPNLLLATPPGPDGTPYTVGCRAGPSLGPVPESLEPQPGASLGRQPPSGPPGKRGQKPCTVPHHASVCFLRRPQRPLSQHCL